MAIIERPLLSRLDLLDNVVRQLEEIRGYKYNNNNNNKSAKSSCESSGTLSSEGQYLSSDFSPKCLEKHCRPLGDVVMETEAKGTLIERLRHLEDRVLKVCLQLEEELEAEKRREDENDEKKLHSHKKGIKQLVSHCVRGKPAKHKAR